jgi:hypothetical protein
VEGKLIPKQRCVVCKRYDCNWSYDLTYGEAYCEHRGGGRGKRILAFLIFAPTYIATLVVLMPLMLIGGIIWSIRKII